MTILRVGTNQKYSDGWEQAFAKGKKAKPAAAKTPAKAVASKKKAAPKKKAKK